MRKILYIFLQLLLVTGLMAQQEPQFNQYMFSRLSLNPASAGVSGAICLSGFYRNQWIGYKNGDTLNVNPRTINISFDMPVYAIKSGVGLSFQHNMTGAETNVDFRIDYAYHKVIQKKHMLSGGISLGLFSKSIDYSKVSPAEEDPLIPGSGKEKGMMTDIGLGVHYQVFRKLYAGVSVSNLLGSSAEIGAPEFDLARHYYIFGGYDIQFKNKKKDTFVLTPGFLFKAAKGSVNLDLNALVTYNDFLWGGLVYRVEDAIGLMAGVNYSGFRAGVSYDYTMNSVFAAGNRNSFEIFVRYCYPIFPGVVKKSGYNTRNL